MATDDHVSLPKGDEVGAWQLTTRASLPKGDGAASHIAHLYFFKLIKPRGLLAGCWLTGLLKKLAGRLTCWPGV